MFTKVFATNNRQFSSILFALLVTVFNGQALAEEQNCEGQTSYGALALFEFFVIIALLGLASIAFFVYIRPRLFLNKNKHCAESGSTTSVFGTTNTNTNAGTAASKSVASKPSRTAKKDKTDKTTSGKAASKTSERTTVNSARSQKSISSDRSRKAQVSSSRSTFSQGRKLNGIRLVSSSRSEKSVVESCEKCETRPSLLKILEYLTPSKRKVDKIAYNPVTYDELLSDTLSTAVALKNYLCFPERKRVLPDASKKPVYELLKSDMPEMPLAFEMTLRTFKDKIYPNMTLWNHPWFLAGRPTGFSYPISIANYVEGLMTCDGTTYESCPALTELDMSMANWYGRALKIPYNFLIEQSSESSLGGGTVFDDVSQCLMNVVLAAKWTKLEEVDKTKPDNVSRMVVYASETACPELEKTCRLAGLTLRKLPANEQNDYSMKAGELDKLISEDQLQQFIPTLICGSVSSPASSKGDNLEEIGRVAKKHKIWLHCDATRTGFLWVDGKLRDTQKGLESCDTIAVDIAQSTLLWTNLQAKFKFSFTGRSKCLNCQDTKNLSYWGFSDHRRFSALKLFFTAQLCGSNGLRSYANRLVDMATCLENLLLPHENLQKFGVVSASTLYLQYKEPDMSKDDMNKYTKRLVQFINSARKIAVSRTMIDGHQVLKLCVSYERIDKTHIESLVSEMKKVLSEFKKCKDNLASSITSICGQLESH